MLHTRNPIYRAHCIYIPDLRSLRYSCHKFLTQMFVKKLQNILLLLEFLLELTVHLWRVNPVSSSPIPDLLKKLSFHSQARELFHGEKYPLRIFLLTIRLAAALPL